MEELCKGLVSAILRSYLHKTLGKLIASLAHRVGWAEGLLMGCENGGHPHAIVVLQIEALDLERAPQPRLLADLMP